VILEYRGNLMGSVKDLMGKKWCWVTMQRTSGNWLNKDMKRESITGKGKLCGKKEYIEYK